MRVIKYFVVAIVLLAAVLLEPAAVARADEIDRTDDIPKVNDSSVEFKKQTKYLITLNFIILL